MLWLSLLAQWAGFLRGLLIECLQARYPLDSRRRFHVAVLGHLYLLCITGPIPTAHVVEHALDVAVIHCREYLIALTVLCS